MFLTGKKLYDVLERCNDLFPAWEKEGNQYWNRNTGEIVRSNGLMMHDAVYRPNSIPDPDGYDEYASIVFGTEDGMPTLDQLTNEGPEHEGDGTPILDQLTGGGLAYNINLDSNLAAEDGNDSPLVDPLSVKVMKE